MNIKKVSKKAVTNEDLNEKLDGLVASNLQLSGVVGKVVIKNEDLDEKIDRLVVNNLQLLEMIVSVKNDLGNKIEDLDKKIETVKTDLSSKIEVEISNLAAITKNGFDEVHEKFRLVDLRFDGVDYRLDKVASRLDGVEYRFDKIEGRLDFIEDNHGTRINLLETQMQVVYPK